MSADGVFSPITGKTSPTLEHDQVDRDDGKQLREHLDQQQREHPEAAALEAEAAERIRGKRAEEHGRDAPSRRR